MKGSEAAFHWVAPRDRGARGEEAEHLGEGAGADGLVKADVGVGGGGGEEGAVAVLGRNKGFLGGSRRMRRERDC